ncbi:complement resistance protein TraT [Acidithiobacillus sp. M4-SHS-6]|uniref:complement resistance protein TraT n=1 Tax=Acidithiobacillus sp. M4-SHS-6 TaxID=3383024 RepID=UPI0039BE13BF
MQKITHLLKPVVLTTAVVALSGCAATEMAIEHRNLAAQSKMSNTIFLTPVPPTEQTVYVQLHNTSDQNLNIPALTQELDAELTAQGYRVVPYTKAHYLLQVNVLSIGKTTESAAQAALGQGYGGTLAGVLAGGAIGGVAGQSYEAAGIGGLAGGAVGFLADSLVHTNTYGMVTDVQVGIRQRHAVKQGTQANLQNGTSTKTQQDIVQVGHWMYYRTRIVSTANQTDLAFKKAKPVLENQLVHSLGGIF